MSLKVKPKQTVFQKFFSRQIPSFTPVRISKPQGKESSSSSMNHIANSKSEPDQVKVTAGKSKEPYDSYSDCDSQLSDCDEEIEIDRIHVSKCSKVVLKSHCFKCGKVDHAVKQCPELAGNSSNNRSFGRRLNSFVNNFFSKSSTVQRPKYTKAWVPISKV